MSDISEYFELWSDCLVWIEDPDAGERLGKLLTQIDELDGSAGLYFFCTAAVLYGAPEELVGREGYTYELDVPEPDWQGFENLMLAAGQYILAVVREDFDMAAALFRAQFDDAGRAIDRTAAFISLVLHVAKEQPSVSYLIQLR